MTANGWLGSPYVGEIVYYQFSSSEQSSLGLVQRLYPAIVTRIFFNDFDYVYDVSIQTEKGVIVKTSVGWGALDKGESQNMDNLIYTTRRMAEYWKLKTFLGINFDPFFIN